MEDKLHKHKTKNLIKLLQSREINVDAGKTLFKRSQFTSSLIKRLGLEYELEGHQGCVNCLEWTPDGRYRLLAYTQLSYSTKRLSWYCIYYPPPDPSI